MRFTTNIMKPLFGCLLFFGIYCSAQSTISGQIDLKDSKAENLKIHLIKLSVDQIGNLKYSKDIAWSSIAKDGSFSFDRKHIADKDAIYKLHVKRMEKAITDTIAQSTPFLLSKSDSIHFQMGAVPLATYLSSSEADKEWQRLREFEKQLFRSQLAKNEEAAQLTNYAKDSLRILMVKLIGVWQLEEKQLLELDISKNPDYYLALLSELKESDMPVAQYLFLEKKLAFLTQEYVERKYAWSTAINIILGLIVLGFGTFFILRKKRSSGVEHHLSRQEQTIQSLILAGKTNKEIANELFISLSTVKTHITNIYSKLKVSNRGELLRRFHN